MMRAARGGTPQLVRIVKRYFVPLFQKVAALIQEGKAAGEFRPVDPLHFMPSMIAVIVFHFTNAPVLRMVTGADPYSPEMVAARRAAVLDFISAALFRKEEDHECAL
jgi:hypothetical protein